MHSAQPRAPLLSSTFLKYLFYYTSLLHIHRPFCIFILFYKLVYIFQELFSMASPWVCLFRAFVFLGYGFNSFSLSLPVWALVCAFFRWQMLIVGISVAGSLSYLYWMLSRPNSSLMTLSATTATTSKLCQ